MNDKISKGYQRQSLSSGILTVMALALTPVSCDSPISTTTKDSDVQDSINDTISPELKLKGQKHIKLCIGSNYTDSGATAEDNYYGNLTDNIYTDFSDLNTDSPGDYTVYYTVTDPSGNSDSLCRFVQVVDCSLFSDWDTSFSINSETITDSLIKARSIVNPGSGKWLSRFFSKIEHSTEIDIGYIGGSITAGAHASEIKFRYTNRLCSFLEKTFPEKKFNVINAGYGGTTSRFGCSRIDEDLLKNDPDLIIIEFAVNDPILLSTDISILETMEGLVRKSMYNDSIPVILFYTMSETGNTECHSSYNLIAEHYEIPVISYHHAISPLLQEGKLSWGDISPDFIHPNNQGHLICSYLLYSFLKEKYISLDSYPVNTQITFQEPFSSDLYQEAGIMKSTGEEGISILINSGCTTMEREKQRIGFIFDQETDSVVLETNYNELTLGFMHTPLPPSRAAISVGMGAPDTISSNTDSLDSEYLFYYQVYKQNENLTKRVKIKACDTLGFQIRYIMYAE